MGSAAVMVQGSAWALMDDSRLWRQMGGRDRRVGLPFIRCFDPFLSPDVKNAGGRKRGRDSPDGDHAAEE
jgi:hypothetical protein